MLVRGANELAIAALLLALLALALWASLLPGKTRWTHGDDE